MDQNRQKWLKVNQNGHLWVIHGQPWTTMATKDRNGKLWTKIDENRQKLTKMDNHRTFMDNHGIPCTDMDYY